MKKALIFILILISLGSSSQTQCDLLEKAYQKKSTKLANLFFENWSKEIPPISKEELDDINDTVWNAYQVFKSFYNPYIIDTFLCHNCKKDKYLNFEYFAIGSNIKIYLTERLQYTEQEVDSYTVKKINRIVKNDSIRKQLLTRNGRKLSDEIIKMYGPNHFDMTDTKDTLVFSVENFRPNISYIDKYPLCLTSAYSEILKEFLGKNQSIKDTSGLLKTYIAKRKNVKKGNHPFRLSLCSSSLSLSPLPCS